jgi:hypothetical protein
VTLVSRTTDDALSDALVAHLQAEEVIADGDLVVAWVVAYVAVCPGVDDATRQGSISPLGQPYYVSHGLAAGLMATFDTGMGDGGGGEDEAE